MLIYLGFSTVAVFIAALLLADAGGTSAPALAHLVFAVGIVPLIFAAIAHFVPVLTRGRAAPRTVRLLPLLLQLTGVLVFRAFIGQAPANALAAAAASTALLALGFVGWLMCRAKATLGTPHPGWLWYLLAILFLATALLLVPAMSAWPPLRPQLRLLHLHLNTLGFIGLSALGTLQVLLPTALRTPDSAAAGRLRRQLPLAAGGVLAVGIGAAFWTPAALLGAAMLLAITLETAFSWLRRYGGQRLLLDPAAATLLAALAGFVLLIGLGVAHAFGVLAGDDAVPAFVVAFLLPLVSGALTQLLPVWYLPGKRTPARDRMHSALRAGGVLRALLFVVGGVLLALGIADALWLAAVATLSFAVAILRSLLRAREERAPS